MGKRYTKNSEGQQAIEATMGDLVRSQGVLGMINNARMPARTGLQVRRIVKAITSELQIYEETRKALLDKYAEKDEKGTAMVENNEYRIADRPAFDAEYQEMLDDIVILDVRPLSIADLESVDIPKPGAPGGEYMPWKPTPVELDAIYYLLNDEPES